jgi:hypothetical protein
MGIDIYNPGNIATGLVEILANKKYTCNNKTRKFVANKRYICLYPKSNVLGFIAFVHCTGLFFRKLLDFNFSAGFVHYCADLHHTPRRKVS